jgi:hypothetical protein
MTLWTPDTYIERIFAESVVSDNEWIYLVPPNQVIDIYGVVGVMFQTDPTGTGNVIFDISGVQYYNQSTFSGGEINQLQFNPLFGGSPRALPGDTINVTFAADLARLDFQLLGLVRWSALPSLP